MRRNLGCALAARIRCEWASRRCEGTRDGVKGHLCTHVVAGRDRHEHRVKAGVCRRRVAGRAEEKVMPRRVLQERALHLRGHSTECPLIIRARVFAARGRVSYDLSCESWRTIASLQSGQSPTRHGARAGARAGILAGGDHAVWDDRKRLVARGCLHRGQHGRSTPCLNKRWPSREKV